MKNKSESGYAKTLKGRLPYAALAGFVAGFSFFFFGVVDIFAQNRSELLFAFSDFGGYAALIATVAFALIAALIVFLPSKASDILFGLVVWACVMGYVQSAFLNGSGQLKGDGTYRASTVLLILDTLIWIITGALCVIGAVKMRKKSIFKTIFAVLLLMVFAMQVTGCISEINEITKSPFETREADASSEQTSSPVQSETDKSTEQTTDAPSDVIERPDVSKAYLTTAGLTEVSSKNNIIIFVIDRFDVSYYEDVIASDPDFFDGLDGFTYFGDNVSMYSRTYPAVVSMITGVENNFSGTMEDYFSKAYTSSAFLKDLKSNGYKIKLYTSDYYAYKNGDPLYGIASNLSVATDYTITDSGALVKNMILLSAYRYLPTCLKPAISVSSASFKGIVSYNGNDPLYEIDDAAVYGELDKNGLSLDGSEKSYIFIHLGGCHDPYTMDADGNKVESSSAEEQLRGDFKLIYKYIDELKRLGVYENSTIIITGDHPRARDDAAIPTQPRLTALFAKAAGSSGALKRSSAQVSQENLIPTIIQSAKINTDKYYGMSYFDIPEGQNVARYHNFELYVSGNNDRIVTLEVYGDGTNFENWSKKSEFEVESIYK